MTIILASKSPRRREILQDLGLNFSIFALDTNESSDEKDPERYVKEIALRKGQAVAERFFSKDKEFLSDCIILACDTVVVSPDGEIMGKPKDKNDARRMLRSFSGRAHRVISGIALVSSEKSVTACESTTVHFDEIDENSLEKYLCTSEAYDKAGAYAIQGYASTWINGIEGDYFNVVGLPVKLLSDTLKKEFGKSLLD